ncbi:uncharacterized protein METZ01_LOCUS183771 [marine metagenome]|uniref:Uncharacterized protein n=1 Tax=marine metagenome TaxID=408172 RepID=A0A382D025_9ZZZZ
MGEESDTQLGRRLSDVRDEISGSQDAIKKAKERWIFEDDNRYWIAGFSLFFIGMILAGLVVPDAMNDGCAPGDTDFMCGPYSWAKISFIDFMGCCFPIIVLTSPPLYVNWKNQRKLVKLEIEKKSLQVALGGKGVDIPKSYKDDEGGPNPKKWLPK